MRIKAVFLCGVATGYVLGSRAGRQRYEQIKRMAKSVSSNPTVKQTTDAMQAQAAQLGAQAKRAMSQKAGAMTHDLAGRVSSKMSAKMPMMGKAHTHRTIDLEAEHSYAGGSTL